MAVDPTARRSEPGLSGPEADEGPVALRAGPRRVCFPYIAQAHQIPHSLPIACELARRHPEIEVRIASNSPALLEAARAFAANYPEARIHYDRLCSPLRRDPRSALLQGARKLATLALNRAYFARFTAIVAPERTTLFLKRRLGVAKPKFIWTRHGAGDRQKGFVPDVADYDFVLLPGAKTERRMLDLGLVRRGDYVTGVYAKFDYVLRSLARVRPFPDGRPTVLYNPHFSPELSSWPAMGRAVLDAFAEAADHNLIFAPHLRLFHPVTGSTARAFERYAGLPNILVDLGSPASVDMTYTLAADVYIGDVSSQLAEFLLEPRPCVFLNPHRVRWEGDPNYRSWSLGEVVESPERLRHALWLAVARQQRRAERQRAYARETFNGGLRFTAHTGADALADYLDRVA